MSDLEDDNVSELPSFDDPFGMSGILEILQKEQTNNPSQFASYWEADEQDVDEATEEEKKNDPVKRILWGAETGNKDIVLEVLNLSSDLVNAKDGDGYTPLHRAAYEGQVEVVQLLIDHGADVNERTLDGWTALHSACCWGQVDVAAILIRHGSDINSQTNGKQTPLHLAAGNSTNHKLFQLLLMNEFIDTTILNQIGERSQDIAQRSCRHHKLFLLADDCINIL